MSEENKQPEPELDPETELMGIEEVMRLTKMSRATIYRHLKNGSPDRRSKGREIDINQIPKYKIGGKIFWSRSAYLELLKENKSITCPKCKYEF